MLERFTTTDEHGLVRWAAEYLTGVADMLERSHTDEFGRIRPAETRVELKLIRAWIRRAGELAAAPPGYVIEDVPTLHVAAGVTELHAAEVLKIVEASIAHRSRRPWPL